MRPIFHLILLFSSTYAISLNGHWDEDDTKRLSQLLENVMLNKKDNIGSLHFAASGLRLLNNAPSDAAAKAACEAAQKADLKKLDVLYHASALSGDLKDCKLAGVSEAQKTIEAVRNEPNPNGERIAQALRSADRLRIKVDKAAFDKLLTAAMKDDSPNNLAWVFNAAALLDKALAAKYFDKIKVLVSQADEVDKRFLQFEGGLSTTANAIHSIMSLAEQQGKVPAVPKDKLLLFTNFLLSRKHVSTEKSAYHLLSALGVLTNNHQLVPVTVTLKGPIMVDRMKPIVIDVCNVFGLPIDASNVRIDIKQRGTNTITMSNLRLANSQASPRSYFFGPDKLPEVPGFYEVAVKVESADKRLIGLTDSSVILKLSDDAIVEDLKIGALEKDEVVSGATLSSITQFSKHGKLITIDMTKRLYISFSVKSRASQQLIQPHQAFVLFKHLDGNEVFFTADVQEGGTYVVDINLAKAYKDFEGVSGKYLGILIIGDATLRTPFNWPFADFSVTVPPVAPEVVPKSQRIDYEKLPEIEHLFRQPEKRPPAFVSDFFTFICLVPLVLLLILWVRVGLNFGNMPASIWTPFFHLGLAALFALYFVFWIQLNMFETLKYLAVIGAFTYLAGNRVLKAIADKRKSKTE